MTMASLSMLAVMGTFCSCGVDGENGETAEAPKSFDGYTTDASLSESGGDSTPSGGPGSGGPGSGGNTQAGIITAGEWNDLDHWSFWLKLMTGEEHSGKSDYWMFYTNNRVAVRVSDAGGKALAGLSVKLQRDGVDVWQAVTDNHGRADLYVSLFQKSDSQPRGLSISIQGQTMDGQPVLCPWDGQQDDNATLDDKWVNSYVCTLPATVRQQADIAFVVDATGSMSDEIKFLKSDLVDIIGKASALRPGMTLRTAALFYRDAGDEYVTRHSNFTNNVSETKNFVDKQSADGGGDYPEAVHTALERMLQNLSWDVEARTRLAFLILDAPAHHQDDIIHSIQNSVMLCAQKGIRLIPVAASGVDKNTEFMLRFFAIATGGTYVFLTDDSGVGNAHIVPTVGQYEVEQLNELIIRLIGQYTE